MSSTTWFSYLSTSTGKQENTNSNNKNSITMNSTNNNKTTPGRKLSLYSMKEDGTIETPEGLKPTALRQKMDYRNHNENSDKMMSGAATSGFRGEVYNGVGGYFCGPVSSAAPYYYHHPPPTTITSSTYHYPPAHMDHHPTSAGAVRGYYYCNPPSMMMSQDWINPQLPLQSQDTASKTTTNDTSVKDYYDRMYHHSSQSSYSTDCTRNSAICSRSSSSAGYQQMQSLCQNWSYPPPGYGNGGTMPHTNTSAAVSAGAANRNNATINTYFHKPSTTCSTSDESGNTHHRLDIHNCNSSLTSHASMMNNANRRDNKLSYPNKLDEKDIPSDEYTTTDYSYNNESEEEEDAIVSGRTPPRYFETGQGRRGQGGENDSFSDSSNSLNTSLTPKLKAGATKTATGAMIASLATMEFHKTTPKSSNKKNISSSNDVSVTSSSGDNGDDEYSVHSTNNNDDYFKSSSKKTLKSRRSENGMTSLASISEKEHQQYSRYEPSSRVSFCHASPSYAYRWKHVDHCDPTNLESSFSSRQALTTSVEDSSGLYDFNCVSNNEQKHETSCDGHEKDRSEQPSGYQSSVHDLSVSSITDTLYSVMDDSTSNTPQNSYASSTNEQKIRNSRKAKEKEEISIEEEESRDDALMSRKKKNQRRSKEVMISGLFQRIADNPSILDKFSSSSVMEEVPKFKHDDTSETQSKYHDLKYSATESCNLNRNIHTIIDEMNDNNVLSANNNDDDIGNEGSNSPKSVSEVNNNNNCNDNLKKNALEFDSMLVENLSTRNYKVEENNGVVENSSTYWKVCGWMEQLVFNKYSHNSNDNYDSNNKLVSLQEVTDHATCIKTMETLVRVSSRLRAANTTLCAATVLPDDESLHQAATETIYGCYNELVNLPIKTLCNIHSCFERVAVGSSSVASIFEPNEADISIWNNNNNSNPEEFRQSSTNNRGYNNDDSTLSISGSWAVHSSFNSDPFDVSKVVSVASTCHFPQFNTQSTIKKKRDDGGDSSSQIIMMMGDEIKSRNIDEELSLETTMQLVAATTTAADNKSLILLHEKVDEEVVECNYKKKNSDQKQFSDDAVDANREDDSAHNNVVVYYSPEDLRRESGGSFEYNNCDQDREEVELDMNGDGGDISCCKNEASLKENNIIDVDFSINCRKVSNTNSKMPLSRNSITNAAGQWMKKTIDHSNNKIEERIIDNVEAE